MISSVFLACPSRVDSVPTCCAASSRPPNISRFVLARRAHGSSKGGGRWQVCGLRLIGFSLRVAAWLCDCVCFCCSSSANIDANFESESKEKTALGCSFNCAALLRPARRPIETKLTHRSTLRLALLFLLLFSSFLPSFLCLACRVFSNYAAGNGHNASSNPNGERHTIDIKDFTNILRLAKLVGGGGQSAQRSATQPGKFAQPGPRCESVLRASPSFAHYVLGLSPSPLSARCSFPCALATRGRECGRCTVGLPQRQTIRIHHLSAATTADTDRLGLDDGVDQRKHARCHSLTSSSVFVCSLFSMSDGNTVSDVEANRLDYSEFCQALVAIAMYKSVDEHREHRSRCWLCIRIRLPQAADAKPTELTVLLVLLRGLPSSAVVAGLQES